MPPRLVVVAIVLFWAGTTGWLFYREVVPQWLAGRDDPPPLNVTLLDEVGSNTAEWRLYLDGKEAGMGLSRVEQRRDRTFVFYSDMRFNNDKKLFDSDSKMFAISKIESINHTNAEGELLDMGFEVSAEGKLLSLFAPAAGPTKFGIKAKAENGSLKPRLFVNGSELMDLKAIPVSKNGLALNPAHVGDRIKDLWPGKSWRIPMVNPITSRPDSIQEGNSVVATVSEDTFHWSKKDVPCFRIDFKPLRDESLTSSFEAASWVRQSDGLVLKQSIIMKTLKLNLQLIRIDEK